MRRELFVDTSAWYALADVDDSNHESAKAFLSEALETHARFTTSNCVVGETYTLIRARLGHREAWEFIMRVKASPSLEITFIDEIMESEAYELLQQFQDQDFSYVDGTSFVLMKKRRIREAFTYDEHFSIVGFTRLPHV